MSYKPTPTHNLQYGGGNNKKSSFNNQNSASLMENMTRRVQLLENNSMVNQQANLSVVKFNSNSNQNQNIQQNYKRTVTYCTKCHRRHPAGAACARNGNNNNRNRSNVSAAGHASHVEEANLVNDYAKMSMGDAKCFGNDVIVDDKMNRIGDTNSVLAEFIDFSEYLEDRDFSKFSESEVRSSLSDLQFKYPKICSSNNSLLACCSWMYTMVVVMVTMRLMMLFLSKK